MRTTDPNLRIVMMTTETVVENGQPLTATKTRASPTLRHPAQMFHYLPSDLA